MTHRYISWGKVSNTHAQHCEKEKVKYEESKNIAENKSAGSSLAHSTTHYSPFVNLQFSPQLLERWISPTHPVFPLPVTTSRQVAASLHILLPSSYFRDKEIGVIQYAVFIIKQPSSSIYPGSSTDFKQRTFEDVYCFLGGIFSLP